MTDLLLSVLPIAEITLGYWSPADETETGSSQVRPDSQIPRVCTNQQSLVESSRLQTGSRIRWDAQRPSRVRSWSLESNKLLTLSEQRTSKELYSDGKILPRLFYTKLCREGECIGRAKHVGASSKYKETEIRNIWPLLPGSATRRRRRRRRRILLWLK